MMETHLVYEISCKCTPRQWALPNVMYLQWNHRLCIMKDMKLSQPVNVLKPLAISCVNVELKSRVLPYVIG
jgi:hypothetical protein